MKEEGKQDTFTRGQKFFSPAAAAAAAAAQDGKRKSTGETQRNGKDPELFLWGFWLWLCWSLASVTWQPVCLLFSETVGVDGRWRLGCVPAHKQMKTADPAPVPNPENVTLFVG
ncbi:hypothetical protein JOB18_021673 [Solea senegalensis]|uniref:Uncharacterized protein n=1 Tax=Solea senegalensis TaxID=28829 RepID=A0AAV6S3R4_SOLSE|nr:hypothetical protein JOB18_021673 [Solea senegalensis]